METDSNCHLRRNATPDYLRDVSDDYTITRMPSHFRDRIRAARKHAGLTQLQIAEACGISREAVAAWESPNRETRPDWTNMRKVSEVTGAPIDWLLDDDNDLTEEWMSKLREPDADDIAPIRAYSVRAVDGNDGVNPETDVMIPEVDVRLSGGSGSIMPEFVETKFEMPFQLWWFKKHGAKPADVRLMKVDGHSMERTLYHDDRVAVNMGDRDRIRDGRVYALVVGSEPRVKRLFNMRDGGVRIVSDNPDKDMYPDEIVPGDDRDSIIVIGRVIDKSGSGGL